jgi:hypothetical protein
MGATASSSRQSRVSCALTFARWHHVLLGRTPGEEANDEHVSDQDPLGD